ncbi:hypothetical protein LIER_43246 [Lithospermum erythrorhizon]|uniref:Transposase-associated domain-containing protein n=1 Tax=Lithospermum erythrorhizon TaxID=34254 RepID=A0AAV3PRZ7_LITER
MAGSRRWMYERHNSDGSYNEKHFKGVANFLIHAGKHAQLIGTDTIRYPCSCSQNIYVFSNVEVDMHICENEFVDGYEYPNIISEYGVGSRNVNDDHNNEIVNMIEDLLWIHDDNDDANHIHEDPNVTTVEY